MLLMFIANTSHHNYKGYVNPSIGMVRDYLCNSTTIISLKFCHPQPQLIPSIPLHGKNI